jgi:hypothetical protein
MRSMYVVRQRGTLGMHGPRQSRCRTPRPLCLVQTVQRIRTGREAAQRFTDMRRNINHNGKKTEPHPNRPDPQTAVRLEPPAPRNINHNGKKPYRRTTVRAVRVGAVRIGSVFFPLWFMLQGVGGLPGLDGSGRSGRFGQGSVFFPLWFMLRGVAAVPLEVGRDDRRHERAFRDVLE